MRRPRLPSQVGIGAITIAIGSAIIITLWSITAVTIGIGGMAVGTGGNGARMAGGFAGEAGCGSFVNGE